MSDRRAFTLVEALVTCSILVLMLLTFGWMLIACKISFQAAVARSGSRQDLDLVLGKIVSELRNSRLSSLTVLDPPVAFSFASAYAQGSFQTTSAGDPDWRVKVVYYAWGGLLLRKEQAAADALPLPKPLLSTLCDGSGKVMMRSLSGVALRSLPGGLVEVNLQTRIQNQHGGALDLSVRSLLQMRN